MKKRLAVLCAAFLVAGGGGRALADNAAILNEIQPLKERIEELEQKLEEQEALAKKQAAKTEKAIGEKIEEALEERFATLEIHGGAILYYQGSQVHQLNGENADCPSGTGADRGGQPNNPVSVLLANLNTIADDNTDGNDTGLNLLEAHYTHEFFDKTLNLTAGKAEILLFLDGNAFANCEKNQFVGKPFVNNSVLDSESEYTPLIGAEVKPMELLALSVVGTTTSRPYVEGWGLGISADQQITEMIGLFGRFGWNNDDVYVVQWEASGGANIKGLIPGRDEDTIGLGFAALTPGDRYAQNDPEYHLEFYYRIAVTENLAFTPDLQYVWTLAATAATTASSPAWLGGEFNF